MKKLIFCVFFLFSFYSYGIIPEKVLICGVCRDVQERLPYTINIMEQIGNLFEDYRVIVYENDSQDLTATLLKKWAVKNTRVCIQSENLQNSTFSQFVNRLDSGKVYRPELIARARNIVLDKALSKEYENFSYLIWMDMDFKISPCFEGIVEVFESNRTWDAVLAYGIDPPGNYWDWYAFRDAVYPLGSELLGNDWWYMTKRFSLTPKDDWYPVYSAFGGCGIYKKKSILGCKYSALVTEDLQYVTQKIMKQKKNKVHPQILRYQKLLGETTSVVNIYEANPNLPRIEDPNIGIRLPFRSSPLIWRMSSFVYQYPSTCEHVPFHASMIRQGHGKIFINPRLIFTYGG